MSIETSWLDAKGAVPGLDQLGIRATAIRMYAHLVPGITNVTDRARYFAIHPYIIDYWARQVHTDDKSAFQNLIRRIECLLAFGEKIRIHQTKEESYGIVGTVQITDWLSGKPHPSQSDYSVPIRAIEEKYFANRWGSLGQYYGGPESELGLIQWKDGLPRITPLGRELATAFSLVADGCNLPSLIGPDELNASALWKVGVDAGFNELSAGELTILRDIVLDLSNRFGEAGTRRRKTCLLLLSLAYQRKSPIDDPSSTVITAALHKRCEEEVLFQCPPPLLEHLELWKAYSFQELLAFASEMILAVSVEVLEGLEIDRSSAPTSVAELTDRTVALLPPSLRHQSIASLIDQSVQSLSYPSPSKKADEWEEETLRAAANQCFKKKKLSEALVCALKLMARISARLPANPYESFSQAKLEIDDRRFGFSNLQELMKRHADAVVPAALHELMTTITNLHLRVATAKLAYNKDFTYKLVYDNGRLRKVRDVEPALSAPRLQQAAQILADLGFLKREQRAFSITPDGIELLNQFGCK